jgi:hypothetical protein
MKKYVERVRVKSMGCWLAVGFCGMGNWPRIFYRGVNSWVIKLFDIFPEERICLV